MHFTFVLFLSAFSISAVAGFYSIAGLVAIFSSQVVASIVMGATLEIGKLVAASWLYRNWTEAPKILIGYFTAAVIILSLITSMGIFGYLSKAHLDQNIVSGGVISEVQLLDDKIKTEKDNIEAARKSLAQMDSTVDQTIARSTSEQSIDKSAALRRSQQKERTQLLNMIGESQKTISTLNEQKAPIYANLRKVEAEVGPIKYVAELVYGESTPDLIDKAVRWVIILIIFVFDPLAILLLIAANMEMKKNIDNPSTDSFNFMDFVPKKEKKKDIASGEDVVMVKRRDILGLDLE